MYDHSTDEELLAAAKADGDAFAEFYERHARSVLVYATTRLGSVDLGAEVTAETFACALEKSGATRPSRQPRRLNHLPAVELREPLDAS